MTSENILQFSPLQSFVSPTFWHKLAETKLDYDRLSDAPKAIFGYYTNHDAKACLLEVDYSAFNADFMPPKFCYASEGTAYNKNTIEDFKECDKSALLTAEGNKLLEDFKSGRILENPSRLTKFFILSFADLKCHNYYYWFAFPCPMTSTIKLHAPPRQLKDSIDLQKFSSILQGLSSEQNQFFVFNAYESAVYSLKEIISKDNFSAKNISDIFFCFADPSEYLHPSWIMRIYATFIFYQCPSLIGKPVKFIGVRYDKQMVPNQSMIWEIVLAEPINLTKESSMKFVGWELNRNNKLGPRMVSMRDSMDPVKLAENMVYLNLKLMKWRLVPDLNLDIISSSKCLLFGAGTLGCAVARNLLSWGFKHISLIDSGKVRYSNPVRQCLYTHGDAAAGNKMKATTAAERLKEINPSAVTAGYVLVIPMPGHTIGASVLEQTTNDLQLITKLVQEHDIIFLLTDSRESRWLPTLLGAAFEKILINAALGFDSYLVMRHGSSRIIDDKSDAAKPLVSELRCINGNKLGCYFCTDVTAPGNSLKDRTLDQQCTVTRPGVSNIAASYAVELLVSILQHPQRELAPAYFSHIQDIKIPEGLLGIIPHSIRGMLFNYENILPATPKFNQCIACSKLIVSEYQNNGNKFLFKAFETEKYLEDLTGISEYKNLNNEIIEFYDSEFTDSD